MTEDGDSPRPTATTGSDLCLPAVYGFDSVSSSALSGGFRRRCCPGWMGYLMTMGAFAIVPLTALLFTREERRVSAESSSD
ncbi:hypothetical protein GCM10022231_34490 [Gordonia caeni]|uniref:Uncharacterized protein n=1 Tax=Gordonia caeni TaxID=1007097 RepID=A0ABP7PS66_9ACTN